MFRHQGFLWDGVEAGTAGSLRTGILGADAVWKYASFLRLKRAIRSLPGVGEGRTMTHAPSTCKAASTGVSWWISAAPLRIRLTRASAVSSSNAIQ